VTTRVVIQRSALKGLLAHAAAVAKASRAEALGWLLGFFTEDAVYVVESAGCTRYRSQTRYGAEAEPTEEGPVLPRQARRPSTLSGNWSAISAGFWPAAGRSAIRGDTGHQPKL